MTYKITLRDESIIIVDDVAKIYSNKEMGTVEMLSKDGEIITVVPIHGLSYIAKVG